MPSGFFYSVKAIVDKASFADGLRELQKLEQSSRKLLMGIAGMGAGAVASATIAGEVATQELRVAKAIGVSSEALSSWKIAANVAGASASGLVGTLSALENKMQHLKTGTVDTGLAKNLGMLGVGYKDFADMDAESRMRTVFNQADQMQDQKLAATLVGDILGQAGRDYYDSLKLSGKSIDQQLQEAKALNFVSNENRKDAALFASEVNSVKEAGKSITMLFGSEMARALTPTVRSVKNYLINNREEIRKGITGFAQNVGAVFNAISGGIEKVAPIVTGLIDKFGGLDQIIIKLGLGFATLKLMNVATGIASIVKSVNLLKMGLAGLAFGGLTAIMHDISAHFQGGKSGIFDILIPTLKKISSEIGLSDSFDGMVDAFKKLRELFDDEKFKTGLKNVKDWFLTLGGNTLQFVVEQLQNIFNLLGAIARGDWQEALKSASNIVTDTTETIGATINGQTTNDYRADEPKRKKLLNLGNDIDAALQGRGQLITLPIIGSIDNRTKMEDLPADLQQKINEYRELSGKSDAYSNYIKDGIISPGGKVTSVSPDDWVFAVKDIADLAGGLLPATTTTNNNVSEPTSYVINQSFTFGNNVRPAEVKMSAYKGTAEALQNNFNRASKYMQLMPGTK